MSQSRFTLKIGGQSGQGINTVGILLSKILNSVGYYTFSYREYPSVIKGGVASYQIDFSSKPINSSSRECDLLCVLEENSLEEYSKTLKKNGLLIHDIENIKTKHDNIFLNTKKILTDLKAPAIMENTLMVSFICKLLEIDLKVVEKEIVEYFQDKEINTKIEKECIQKIYTEITYDAKYSQKKNLPPLAVVKQNKQIIDGNKALSLGAIGAGVRAYYAYPMTPITAIFKYLSNTQDKTGILLKQAENEITAIHMAMGSMYMGTRALVATSGGGFDLMTETISCSSVTETPLVVILGQRAGAGTGVPTWTGNSDLELAIKSGHGQHQKCVLATSDIESSFTLIQKAFNISEKYQIPVILLTEKQITESLFTITKIPTNIPVKRNLLQMNQRYKITKDGISPRRIPSFNNAPYLVNSDEHDENGYTTEESKSIIEMSDKRERKLKTLQKELPQPRLFNPHKSNTILVGWGSAKNTVIDLIHQGEDIGYLHYEYMYPLKTELLETLIARRKKLILIENNQTGQLGKMIQEKTGYKFRKRILKYDGRPFFVEDILDALKNDK